MYKLAFGPKAFVVVSDPIVARHILRENAFRYDKVQSVLCSSVCIRYLYLSMVMIILVFLLFYLFQNEKIFNL